MAKLDQDISFRHIPLQLIDCCHLFSARNCTTREGRREAGEENTIGNKEKREKKEPKR